MNDIVLYSSLVAVKTNEKNNQLPFVLIEGVRVVDITLCELSLGIIIYLENNICIYTFSDISRTSEGDFFIDAENWSICDETANYCMALTSSYELIEDTCED